MGRPAWRLDPALRTAERMSACPLSLNGIAKGFIVERACEVALDPGSGVTGVMLNVGGDLRVRGEIDGTIGIAAPWADSESSEPLAFIAVKDRSVATSGNSQRGFRINGRWYSHIFDPRSGLPVDRIVAATVIAERSVDADAFAKVCNILDPEESVRMARSLPGVECLIVAKDGRTTRSDGWRRYECPRPDMASLRGRSQACRPRKPGAAPGQAEGRGEGRRRRHPWNKEFELVVNLEINHPEAEAGRYRRPYVAVWVEDKDGNSVRTLSLWVSMGGAGPFQWLPDLKRWYAARSRPEAPRQEGAVLHDRAANPPGRQVQGHLGRQGRPRQAAPGRRIYHLHRGRARARDLSEHPQASDSFRQAVHRGTQGQCRDPIRLDRVSSKGSGKK